MLRDVMRSARRAWYLVALLLVVAAQACAPTSPGVPGDQRGTIVHRTLTHGEYMEYVPRGTTRGILVIAHGSTEGERSEQDLRKLAETFLRRWVRFADDHGLIAVAPVFDHNFGSWVSEPGIILGGYRGLAGKEIGADEFVDRIVDQYRQQVDSVERFYLYGHSAGGQFAGRYAVRHPDRLKALILSAPGRYAFPDPQAPWPYGQKEVTVRVSPEAAPQVIRPDRDGWRKAAALPITVVVGTVDTEPQPPRAGHVGKTRVDYARQWVEAMTRIAPEGKSRIRLVTVPGIGHSSSGLTWACQKALAEYLREEGSPSSGS
jgi:pimeloyl-ACP methyl ester carboxylesterase